MQLHRHYPNAVTSRVYRSEDVCTAEKVHGFPDECVYLRPLCPLLSGEQGAKRRYYGKRAAVWTRPLGSASVHIGRTAPVSTLSSC